MVESSVAVRALAAAVTVDETLLRPAMSRYSARMSKPPGLGATSRAVQAASAAAWPSARPELSRDQGVALARISVRRVPRPAPIAASAGTAAANGRRM